MTIPANTGPDYDSSRLLEEEPLWPVKKKKSPWQHVVGFFAICAEIANVGIVFEIIARWFPRIAFMLHTTLGSYLILIADPLIYFFRALIRLTRIVGRECFGVRFDEEELGTHPLQDLGDLVAMIFFMLAVALFLGALVAPPVGITLAWGMGLAGLSLVGYFDYVVPQKKAEEECDRLARDPEATQSMKNQAELHHDNKLHSKRLFLALLLGLSLLLLCGSAIAFAPPLLVPILLATSKVASLFLTAIACTRFFNWCFSTSQPELENLEELPDKVEPALAIRPGLSSQLHGAGLYIKPPIELGPDLPPKTPQPDPVDNSRRWSLSNNSQGQGQPNQRRDSIIVEIASPSVSSYHSL